MISSRHANVQVLHDDSEEAATISESEASATSRALWEAALEARITASRTDLAFI